MSFGVYLPMVSTLGYFARLVWLEILDYQAGSSPVQTAQQSNVSRVEDGFDHII